jgi:hypothetical protein
MARTDSFRKQHREILEIITESSSALERPLDDAAIETLRKAISTLSGKVGIHLAMEDEGLYPELLKHGDAQVKALAERYWSGMGGLRQSLGDYKKRWASSAAIRQDKEAFVSATKRLFTALRGRIAAEDNELYPRVDALA